MRIGIGFDAHKLIEGRPLFLGGVQIPFNKGLLGHSDADVLLHAIIDALLGATALGNIGQYFPDSDPGLEGISSIVLLEKTKKLLDENNYIVSNLDSVVILEQPRLETYWPQMKQVISNTLQIEPTAVSLKAKTTEKMGFTGRGEGISAMATVLVGIDT